MAAARSADATAPAHNAIAITPSDVVTIPTTRAVYVGTTGNLAVRMADGSSVTFNTVPVGIFAIQVSMVLSTGTSASNLVALY